MSMKKLLHARDCVEAAVKSLAATKPKPSSGPVWLALNAAQNAQAALDEVIAAERLRLDALMEDFEAGLVASDKDY